MDWLLESGRVLWRVSVWVVRIVVVPVVQHLATALSRIRPWSASAAVHIYAQKTSVDRGGVSGDILRFTTKELTKNDFLGWNFVWATAKVVVVFKGHHSLAGIPEEKLHALVKNRLEGVGWRIQSVDKPRLVAGRVEIDAWPENNVCWHIGEVLGNG